MTASPQVPIFDGHNDVLLRLYKRGGADAPRAFLDGEGKGQLDLPMARQGGFAGGLFAIFVPSPQASTGQASTGAIATSAPQPAGNEARTPPPVELVPAQRAVFTMLSVLLRIERVDRPGAAPGDQPVAFTRAGPQGRRAGTGSPYRGRRGDRRGFRAP